MLNILGAPVMCIIQFRIPKPCFLNHCLFLDIAYCHNEHIIIISCLNNNNRSSGPKNNPVLHQVTNTIIIYILYVLLTVMVI